MAAGVTCPRCGHKKCYAIRRAKHRCAGCRYEWGAERLPLRLTARQWAAVLRWFLLGLSSARIATQTGLERRRILRALTRVRQAMARDLPPVFSGVIEVDETYLGGRRRNLRAPQRRGPVKDGRGTAKAPVFGILCRGGHVWAQLVPDVQAATLLPLLRARVRPGSIVCSDTWRSYTGIAAKGYVHRLVDHTQGAYVSRRGTHINGLEGFWGYLKRHLAAKGGIRRERLPLYLAEYVWRYNHRRQSGLPQRRRLLRLLRQEP